MGRVKQDRSCRFCGADITGRHGNAIQCLSCERARLRAYQRQLRRRATSAGTAGDG